MNNSLRVMIVQGSPHQTGTIAPLLDEVGFTTRSVSDHVSALGTLEIWQPDVAVIDLRHPSSEARQFCAALAERTERETPPLVLVGEGPNLLKDYGVVPSGLLQMPVDASKLIATVNRAVDANVSAIHGHRQVTI